MPEIQRVQMTPRDEVLLSWLAISRVVTPSVIRVWLGLAEGEDRPRSLQKASRWIARMVAARQVETARPFVSESLVMLKPGALSAPEDMARVNPLSAVIRHEVAVSREISKWISKGYAVSRPVLVSGSHMPDFMAEINGKVTAVEVELSAKGGKRLTGIFKAWESALARGELDAVFYSCAPVAKAGLVDARKRIVHESDSEKLQVKVCFTHEGAVVQEELSDDDFEHLFGGDSL